jgi:hypothetical protein
MMFTAASAKDVATALDRWFEAPSFRAGFQHLLGRRARMEADVARLLDTSITTPETLAAVMNKIRPGWITASWKRRKLPCDMTTEYAKRIQATLTPSELADSIETALNDRCPNKTNMADAFDALWRVEVEAPRCGRVYDKDDPDIIAARKARKVLGQARKRGRPKGSYAAKRRR